MRFMRSSGKVMGVKWRWAKRGLAACPVCPVRGRWVKCGWQPPNQVGAGGGFTALYRIFCIGILLVWCGRECQVVGQPPNQVEAGGGFTDFYIGILLAWCGGVRFRIIRLLPVLPRLEVGCQRPRSGVVRIV